MILTEGAKLILENQCVIMIALLANDNQGVVEKMREQLTKTRAAIQMAKVVNG